jgi:transcriptional regulator with XRE-family HTH domain
MKIDIFPYRNYRWKDKDPIIDALRTVRNDEGLTNHETAQITGVAASTFKNWFDGETRRPMNSTSTQMAAALGYVRRDELRADGTVVVGFVKAREYDYVAERKKQADWIIRTHGPKKKRKAGKKKNGRM